MPFQAGTLAVTAFRVDVRGDLWTDTLLKRYGRRSCVTHLPFRCARPASGTIGFLICLQPGDNSIETFPPIFVFDVRNAPLEILDNAVDLP